MVLHVKKKFSKVQVEIDCRLDKVVNCSKHLLNEIGNMGLRKEGRSIGLDEWSMCRHESHKKIHSPLEFII